MKKKEKYAQKVRSDPTLTSFQKKVLLKVLNIPEGQVKSYRQIAQEAGSPKAWRAIGTALKKNPYAPFVPCHRVIASTGKIGGYSGGVAEKRRLLEKEGLIVG